jgi:phospholipid transport system substrate-binding protein
MVALAAAGTATASPDAEVFTQKLIDQGVGILRNTADPMRRTKFRDFITQYADVEKTALFTLGNYRRAANPADLSGFVNAFREFATVTYESRLDQYKGQSLKVTGSIDNKPGDITVNTVVVDPNARQPFRVAFRLLGGNSNYRFVDIQVEGIWLSVEQRDQFAAFLSQNNGSIPRLTSDLNARAQRVLAGMGR